MVGYRTSQYFSQIFMRNVGMKPQEYKNRGKNENRAKEKGQKHLKGRILRSISLILICSMILSTLIGYLYFNQVVRKQRLEEEKTV